MTPRQCFGVILRVFGLLMLGVSALYLYSTAYAFFYPSVPHNSTTANYLAAFILTLAAALYLLRGAPQLLRFAYPRSASSQDSDDA
jgi:hypothetical protein